jgi:hypothetical protein
LGHTLKARFSLHLAEVRGVSMYQNALAEGRGRGSSTRADNYTATFSGLPLQARTSGTSSTSCSGPGYLCPTRSSSIC